MKPLYLDWNLGLGDALICNGLVRWLARTREMVVPSYEHNFPTVSHMFSDLPNVHVHIVVGDSPQPLEGNDMLSIGINAKGFGEDPQWDRQFYTLAGVPFDAKWDCFHVPQSGTELTSPDGGFALKHDDTHRGFGVDYDTVQRAQGAGRWDHRWPLFEIDHRRAILTDWRMVIAAASEIHCIDSSVLHMAELMPTTGKLFYHKYARAKGNPNHRDPVLRKPWTVLE